MTTKNIKIALFGALIVALILPVSSIGLVDAAEIKVPNEKDKTLEKEKHRQIIDKNVEQYKAHMEKVIDLKESISSAQINKLDTNEFESALANENARWDEIASKIKTEHTIPENQMNSMMADQRVFEERFLKTDLKNSIVSVGIDLITKEIEIGINVDPEEKDQIINSITELMPETAPWHVYDSERVQLDSCSSEKYCVPLLGGNTVKTGLGTCSNGFKATLGGVYGFVTAGHCTEGEDGNDVDDWNDDKLGEAGTETLFWGTDCDCGFVEASSSETDNKTLLSTTSSVTVASYTTASNQDNDFIYKSGQTNSGLTYGQVTALNVSNSGYDPTIGFFYVTGLVKSTASSTGGDSGGAVMGGSNSDSLYGIIQGHAGSNYYHTPSDNIIDTLGIAIVM